MSIARISSAVAGRPKPNTGAAGAVCRAAAAPGAHTTPTAATPAASMLRVLCRIVVRHRSIRRHAPVLLAVVVVDRRGTPHTDELFAGWLHVTRLVGRPTDEHGLGAVPRPREQESRVGDRQHGIHESCLGPRLPPVGAH